MEFLKELFGDQALTFDQLQTAAQSKGLEIVNAAGGAYVAKADADNLRGQVNTFKQELNKQKFEFALEKALSKSGARSGAAVRGLLKCDKLQLTDDGEILGLDKQLDALKKAEDTAFLFEKAETGGSTGMSHEGGTEVKLSKKEAANEAIRAAFGIRK